MAVIHDVIAPFDLLQPDSAQAAQHLLAQHPDAWVMAGGMDTFDWIKDRIKKPEIVVDLSGVAELRGVRVHGDAIEIGATTTLTEVATHPAIQQRFGVLAEAAGLVASPQIRNQGTLGGNISQDVRCWYYRAGWPCYRAGGNLCFADTPVGRNREHAIFGANRCVAVHPSDTAPALTALDAELVILGSQGERVIPIEDYFVGPEIDITRIHALQPGELLTAIRIPPTWAGARFYFEKVRDRNVWDFPLLNIAAAIRMSGDSIADLRLVVNAAAAKPMRLRAAENAARGKAANAATGAACGAVAVEGAAPLQFNGYKIPLMRNLVKRAIGGVQEASWTV